MIRPREIFLVIAIGVFWGLNWPAVKTILTEVPPWTLRASALSIGAVCLVLLTLAAGQKLRASRGELAWLALAGLFTVFGFNLLAAFGQLFAASSTAAIVAFTMPMWAVLLSALFLGEPITWRKTGALALGLSGLALLIGGEFAAVLARPQGVLFMLGAALSWAAGTVVLKARPWTLRPLARTTWLVGIAAAPLVVGAFVFENPLAMTPPTTPVLAIFVYHVAFPMVFCHAAWVLLVDRLPASIAAIGTLLIPIVGVLSSAVLLGDSISWTKALALILVLSSIVLTFAKRSTRT